MHRRGDQLILSATDLVGFLHCGHLTNLEIAALNGQVHKPIQREDPEVQLLQRRGGAHEQRYIEHLELRENRTVVRLAADWDRPYEERAAETEAFMREGVDVIYQATVFDGRWVGHPDFLLRTKGRPTNPADSPSPSDLIHKSDSGVQVALQTPPSPGGQTGLGWEWHYEVADTKLAHSAKASALLQIASYVEQIERIQGVRPELAYVVTGGAESKPHPFRTAEMMAYYRRAKRDLEEYLTAKPGIPTWPIHRDTSYPDPVDHCAVCKWFPAYCLPQWRTDDALPLIAGISRGQREVLVTNGVMARGNLAVLERPFEFTDELKRAQDESMWRTREQARLQVASTQQHKVLYELLDPEQDATGALVADRGLSALPPPSEGDLFFDIEGDPFAFWEGLEYLFGVWERPQGLGLVDDGYRAIWSYDESAAAFTRDGEKQAFRKIMAVFMERLAAYPDMHIYHYAPYEPTALKRLAGRHAMLEEELDTLLRKRVFVDLYRVVRQGVRVGAESYSIKKLEPLYGYNREIELRDANSSIVEFEQVLEIGDPDGSLKEQIRLYNRDDCISTERLRDWLEQRRPEARRQFGYELPRPAEPVDKPPEDFTARQAALVALSERLTASIPEDQTRQTDSDRATWLLRHLLDWHRRENKAAWWRYYELLSLSEDDLFEEVEPIAHLEFVERIERSGRGVSTDDWRYRFPPQEHKIKPKVEVHDPEAEEGSTKTGSVAAVDDDARTVDIRRPKTWDGRHPESIVPLDIYRVPAQQEALMRIGNWVADNGMASTSTEWQAARDLLLRHAPRAGQLVDAELAGPGESGAQAAVRLATQLAGTTLAIQGPPGSGKSTIGAEMIVELVRAGKCVGVTANSHKVINNLLEKVGRAAAERTPPVEVRAMHKVDNDDEFKDGFAKCVKDNDKVDVALAGTEVDVVGGTAWLWSRDDVSGLIDTLFVDEAGQMSLANVVAMSGSARNIVLLGDPQQLEQPIHGSHPPGAEKSALGHLLGDAETIDPRYGIFFEKTWRLHPALCQFTSELFYEGRLEPIDGLATQEVLEGPWAGSGLRWVEVLGEGNTNESVTEADAVVRIVSELVGRPWRNRRGDVQPLTQRDILIVSPFNSHRILIDGLLGAAGFSDVAVGTVDKFQGQEAPVSIYTMATSRPEDAPRGMAFLYSLNRLNVATSRAQALAIVVASPALLKVVPRTPAQLRMANGLAAFVEAAAADALRPYIEEPLPPTAAITDLVSTSGV